MKSVNDATKEHGAVKQKGHNQAAVKYWEIIADNLSKAGWSWGCVSALDANGERSGSRTRITTTGSVTLCELMKY